MATATTAQVKVHNRHQVLDHIYRNQGSSKQDIMRALNMSLPTITQNLRDLEADGLIRRGGFLKSTGGRKPQIYTFNNRAAIAIGVRMTARQIILCAVDLRGTCIKRATGRLPYRHAHAYYHRICQLIEQFIGSLGEDSEHVIGVAFCMQGIVSADGRSIAFGDILGNTGLSVDEFARELTVPCTFIHDSDASAMAELWMDPSISDALCIYLEPYMGGAVIIDGRLRQGGTMKNGTIEHMTLVPDGDDCYCGQKGCADVYCSARVLLEHRDETLDEFFNQVRDDEYAHRRIFGVYLDHLALAIKNMCTVLNCDVIVGGKAGQFFTTDDIADLRDRVLRISAFPDDDFTIRKSVCHPDQDVIGSALIYVREFMDSVCGAD
ncbi:ROK family transcriptional regulator [Bifidobacterium callimiconis]|uniref:ROK family transcriptional regulator n=1 Tax=Bifidobacterium callimiconis TaxID=2306973 RepID=UPI001BDBF0A9|nr:ROK family transcriptional regulator [Bifidobacterium callimiconis]MBT1176231.1 ROK family transcriptional regulator [Bifidobacterium callimiconis]